MWYSIIVSYMGQWGFWLAAVIAFLSILFVTWGVKTYHRDNAVAGYLNLSRENYRNQMFRFSRDPMIIALNDEYNFKLGWRTLGTALGYLLFIILLFSVFTIILPPHILYAIL